MLVTNAPLDVSACTETLASGVPLAALVTVPLMPPPKASVKLTLLSVASAVTASGVPAVTLLQPVGQEIPLYSWSTNPATPNVRAKYVPGGTRMLKTPLALVCVPPTKAPDELKTLTLAFAIGAPPTAALAVPVIVPPRPNEKLTFAVVAGGVTVTAVPADRLQNPRQRTLANTLSTYPAVLAVAT